MTFSDNVGKFALSASLQSITIITATLAVMALTAHAARPPGDITSKPCGSCSSRNMQDTGQLRGPCGGICDECPKQSYCQTYQELIA